MITNPKSPWRDFKPKVIAPKAERMSLPEEYAALHAAGKFPGTTVLNYAGTLQRIFDRYEVKTCLDYGCGQGIPHRFWMGGCNSTISEIFPGVHFDLFDPYVPGLDKLQDKSYDAVICIDVVEHIPEGQLPQTFRSIFKRALGVFVMTFCNRPARKTFSDGSNIHITLHPWDWWEAKVNEYNTNHIPVYIKETP